MAGAQIATSVTILNSLKGFQSISLKEYNTSAAAAIASGSVVEIAGAYFTFAGDENINASSWTAIATGSTAYIALTPSGTAGSQIVTASYLGTAPIWRDDLQGWYASAASNVRVIGSVYKAEATNYGPKYLYGNEQDGKHLFTSSLSILGALTVGGSASVASTLTVGGSASVASSMTISSNPVASIYTASAPSTVDYPVGTILSYRDSGFIVLNTPVTPYAYIAPGLSYTTMVKNSSTATVIGTWMTRGLVHASTFSYIIQRIS
jgi:hypothetical protein